MKRKASDGHNNASDCDGQQREDLEEHKNITKPRPHFGRDAVHDRNRRQAKKCDSLVCPGRDVLCLGPDNGANDVLAEDD